MSTQRYEQVGVAMTCRGYEEYVRMFDLKEADLSAGQVLDVAAGGSSFTADANERGYSAVAVDPRYGAGVQQWVMEAEQEIETSTAKLAKLADAFDWSYYGTLEQHREGRKASHARFTADVLSNDHKQNYVGGQLPDLPFSDERFSLVLCSHFMFLYANHFGPDFHVKSIFELMRICKPGGQIRIYPLISLNWELYPELERLIETINRSGATTELLPSKLPFIPGSDYFLRISL
ncbi:class I SAM-dependent methyltransferase [Paenibacillus alkaliterrae]|uniref:class I SAM-dependent methyltransferase n=1 Tax=Paenibacillus alkaliterrae TaxID=320909 RepID=UPI001F175322|nr:class I SAM-dependent methyltransferase [Paenibacillus alkaliterrae]MCF2938781.1 class I SAM-dependent methyltransferase [Paenibacillus alkaliterrae]